MLTIQRLSVIVIAGAALAVAAGCAGSKREQTLESGVSTINNVSMMLDTVNARIGKTSEAVTKLSVQGADATAAANNLDRQIKALDESAELTRTEAKRMRSLGDSYFIEWEKEHARNAGSAEDAVATSQAERRSYQRVMDAMDIAGANFRSLTDALRDLQLEVADGYTQSEIGALIERANMRSIDARNAITALQTELDRITTNYKSQYGR